MAPSRAGRGRGRGRGGRHPGAGGRAPYNASAQAMDSFLAGAMKDFSMRDEARNTARDHLKWNSDERLRYRPVTFISAGLIEPLKEFQVDDKTGNENEKADVSPAETSSTPSKSQDKLNSAPSLQTDTQIPTPSVQDEDIKPASSPVRAHASSSVKPGTFDITHGDTLFMLDTVGDKTLRKEPKKPVKIEFKEDDDPAADDTDSSHEVVLFKGRAAPRKPPVPSQSRVQESRKDIELLVKTQSERLHVSATVEKVTVAPAPLPSDQSLTNQNSPHSPSRKADASDFEGDNEDDEDAALADYMENMDGLDDLIAHHRKFASRDIGGSDGDVVIGADSDSDDLSDSDDDEIGDGESPMDDPRSAEEDMAADIDDAELARLLAKQEELGLFGEELVLFDGAVSGRDAPARRPRRNKARSSKQKASASHQTDSAKTVADAFDDLDLMDWDHMNSLRKKPKGKHGALKLTNEDAELQAIMDATYEKDRLKKKERKREREELRAKGLLGKNPNPNDPRVKFVDGINITELREEFTRFLLTLDQVLTLPPMDASARKVVHEIAMKLGVKSKSTGKGDQRRPVLHRTKTTSLYSIEVMDKAFARIHRRHFPRLDKQSRGGGGNRGGGAHASIRYRDGEVVGGSAPELGETNKGRTMLEKMGWSKGMGLGALDNKGILEPVAHVVKTSKAGLG
ncbi:uncharacterized protein PgNI_00434 [Pyricularia grisea]|uniref:Protein SQS1 n=1 Tax=Pyricularia grisea TaxID=148305 RepID=A0A6P8BH35_PYRGI|nr:uncharacterized protein PgNI_00434 [Pyricularia grisea]TLD15962.1 hypothetical protein PgNI_00434 [Pyricularia grisea]